MRRTAAAILVSISDRFLFDRSMRSGRNAWSSVPNSFQRIGSESRLCRRNSVVGLAGGICSGGKSGCPSGTNRGIGSGTSLKIAAGLYWIWAFFCDSVGRAKHARQCIPGSSLICSADGGRVSFCSCAALAFTTKKTKYRPVFSEPVRAFSGTVGCSDRGRCVWISAAVRIHPVFSYAGRGAWVIAARRGRAGFSDALGGLFRV